MMKCIVLIVFLPFFVMAHSQMNNPQSKSGDLPVVDFSKNHPQKKDIILQDIAVIEYIRLETTDNVILSGVRSMSDVSKIASISDNYIVIYEQIRGDIFVFNRNGKIVSHFNHRGQSGREYSLITNSGVIFDEKNEEIYVCSKLVQVYSLNGQHKRTLRIDSNSSVKICNFDDETLLVYEETMTPGHEKYTKCGVTIV